MITVHIPTIYYWIEYSLDIPVLMTAVFTYKGKNYGMSFKYDEKRVTINKQILFNNVRDTLDLMIHHGDRAFDSSGNLHPRKVLDEEAERFFRDPLWAGRIKAFRKAVLIKEITREQAVKLKLL